MRAKIELPRPGNWIQLELVCLKVFGHLWQIPHLIDFNSTNDQGQNGVDIAGIPKGEDGYFGVQVKNKQLHLKTGEPNSLSKKTIDLEIQRAESFQPSLKHLIIATSLSKDKGLETYVREINLQRIKAGLFSVQICFWDFISDKIQENRMLLNWYLAHGDVSSSYSVDVFLDNGRSEKIYRPEFAMDIQYHRHITPEEKENEEREYKEAWDSFLKDKTFFNWRESISSRLKDTWGKITKRTMGEVRLVSINGKPPGSIYPYKLIADRVLSLGLNEYDYQPLCYFNLIIKNTGLQPIEDYKMEFEVSGRYEEFGIEGPRITEAINKTYQSHSRVLSKSMGIIRPENNLLVQQDSFKSYSFYIKPAMIGESEIFVDWKLIARDFNEQGRLTLFVKPRYQKQESVWIIGPNDQSSTKCVVNYIRKKGIIQPNV